MLSSLKKGGSFLLAILDTLKTPCGKVRWEALGTTEFHFKPSQLQTQKICATVHVSRFAPKINTSIKDLQDDSCLKKPENKVCRGALNFTCDTTDLLNNRMHIRKDPIHMRDFFGEDTHTHMYVCVWRLSCKLHNL